MTLKELIALADAVRPNGFTNELKTQWVNQAEGKVQTEIMLLRSEDSLQYDYETDEGTPLLVPEPHDKLYLSYLMAMIDFANAQYGDYQNSSELFNSQFSEYARYYARLYAPADRPRLPFRIYTAVRGSSISLEFYALPVEPEKVEGWYLYIQQRGENVLSYTGEGLKGGLIRVEIPQTDSLSLKPGIAKAVLIVIDTDGKRYESLPAGRLRIFPTVKGEVLT